MNTRILSVSLVMPFLAIGCAGESGGDQFCGRVQQCAERSGAAFSETECRTDLQKLSEQADTAGCGDEYADYMDCVGALEFACSDDLETMIRTECGAKMKKVGKCTGGAIGLDDCQDAAARITDKSEECGLPPSSSSEGSSARCSEEQAESAQHVAACYEAASCAAIKGEDTDGATELGACFSN